MPERRKRILIVDENVDGRRLMRLALREMGAEIIEARGISEAHQALEEGLVDLVITELPFGSDLTAGISIIGLARAIAQKGTAILVYTSHVMQGAEEKAYRAGADEFMSKPAPNLNMVREAVAALLENQAPQLH